MKARIGDLAIARFDNTGHPDGKKWCEVLCLITRHYECSGIHPLSKERWFDFLCWAKKGRSIETWTESLPVSRLVRVWPKRSWNRILGENFNLLNLTLDDVKSDKRR